MFSPENFKARNWVRRVRFRLGRLFFPLLEPLFILWENLRPEVRRHFDQAIRSLEQKNIAVSLLNLNMVLSLRPDHFLARVYRGRIYLRENQFRLASDDFLQANKISPYRFTHYGLYHEYLNSVTEGMGSTGNACANRFNQSLQNPTLAMDSGLEGALSDLPEQLESSSEIDCYLENEMPVDAIDLTREEIFKFQNMGPITGKEIEETDWESVIRKLTS